MAHGDDTLLPIMQRLAVAVDGRPWLRLPGPRQHLWRLVAGAVVGLVAEAQQTARERAEQRTAEELAAAKEELAALEVRLDDTLAVWAGIVRHAHEAGQLSCALCAAYKGAIRDLKRARER